MWEDWLCIAKPGNDRLLPTDLGYPSPFFQSEGLE